MPFSWYHPDVPTEYEVSADKALAMYERELGQRAALLMRLGYPKEEVALRLRGNVAWDFERNDAPKTLPGRVDALVDEVFRNRGYGGGGPPSLEG